MMPVFKRQRQEDLHEFKASLDDTASSRPTRGYNETLPQTNTQTKQKTRKTTKPQVKPEWWHRFDISALRRLRTMVTSSKSG